MTGHMCTVRYETGEVSERIKILGNHAELNSYDRWI